MSIAWFAGEDPVVRVGSDGTALEIGRLSRASADGYWRFPLVVRALNLTAVATIELAGWGGGQPAFIGFFDDLAAGWRGWSGSKSWSDDEGGVEFEAEHPRTGPVLLTVRLRPSHGYAGAGSWSLEVVVPIDPGSLDSIAASVRTLFDRA